MPRKLWKKGEPSPNPKGRPVGSKSFSTDFDEVVEEVAKQNNITFSEARKILLRKAFLEAKDGNFPFYKDICDRYYGKAPDVLSGGYLIEVKNFKEILKEIEKE